MEIKCFIISPIGLENSDKRKHADIVLNSIIRPALEEFDIKTIRADDFDYEKPGLINNDMINAIINYNFCIAILSFLNVNVFYEVAIAHAYRKSVILLTNEDQLPFDIHPHRAIKYQLGDENSDYSNIINKIKGQVEYLITHNWEIEPIFPELSTDILSQEVLVEGNFPWDSIIENAESRFDTMGIALNKWKRDTSFFEKIKNKKFKVRILILDPKNPFINQIINEEIPGIYHKGIINEIYESIEHFSKIAKDNKNFEFRLIRIGCPTSSLIITDKDGVYIPYFYSEGTAKSPHWHCKPNSSLYSKLEKEFENLWKINAIFKDI